MPLDTLAGLIGGQEDMRVVGIAARESDAVRLCRELAPDLAVIGVAEDESAEGLAATALLRHELPGTKVMLMAAGREERLFDAAWNAGAHSLLGRDGSGWDLLYAIRFTVNGQGIYPGPAA